MANLMFVVIFVVSLFSSVSLSSAWGTNGHYMVCKTAQSYLTSTASSSVLNLLPSSANGNLASMCTWADNEIVIIVVELASERCVVGAINNYTTQLKTYPSTTYNLTQALMFLSHFMGDVHQPLHVGFTTDAGGNSITVYWYNVQTNLHSVWDTKIIQSSESNYFGNDVNRMSDSIKANITPEVIAPAKPTPHEVKSLSENDDISDSLRYYPSNMYLYRANPSNGANDPANVIKAALAKALVYYYPIAGRLREQPDGKLVVDCIGDGVMFVEADADVSLEYLGDPLTQPLSFIDQLQFDSKLMGPGVVDQPLLYMQVTRFKCGGFTLEVKICHIIADAPGIAQFLTAICELARGAKQPSVLPVWDRHLLLARDPPVPTHIHREYEPIEDATQLEYDMILKTPPANLMHRTFFFGPKEISALRQHVQSLKPMSHVSRFGLLTAAIWISRTISLDYNSDFEVRVLFAVNSREKMVPPLPTGFYGNAVARAVAFSKAGKLCSSPLEYALKLVKEAKAEATSSDFIQSLADTVVQRKRPPFMLARTFMVSDLTRAGIQTFDFGWGDGMFDVKLLSWVVTFYKSFKNSVGEEVVVVPMCLPEPAMARFKEEMESLIMAPKLSRFPVGLTGLYRNRL